MLTIPPSSPIPEGLLRIGDVAELTGLSLRSIRHYEDLGLVAPTARTEGGFREYDAEAVERLRLVMVLKLTGLQLEEIGPVVDACRAAENRDAGVDPAAVETAADHVATALEDLQARIAPLRELHARLLAARAGEQGDRARAAGRLA